MKTAAATPKLKNLPLVLLLILCTGFILVLNLSYLRNIVNNSDLRASPVDDGPPQSKRTRQAEGGTKSKSSAAGVVAKESHRVAGLSCDQYGGPSEEIAAEMVYWRDIPQDAEFVSPHAKYGQSPKYLTFEPDEVRNPFLMNELFYVVLQGSNFPWNWWLNHQASDL